MMKKQLSAALSVVLAMSLAGCGSDSASASTASASAAGEGEYDYLLDTDDLEKPDLDLSDADGVLKDVLDSGTLTVVTSPDYPPAEWVEDDGTVYGSEMMLAKYIADCLGVDLEIETVEFNSTFASVDTGKADLALSGYGWKKDRAENYELSEGYVGDDSEVTYHTLIVPAGEEDNYNSLEDFVGKHIVAQANSLQEMYVEDEIIALDPDGGTELEQVATLDQAVLSLSSGKCDAVALDGTTAENYVASSDGAFAMSGVNFDLTPYGDYEGNVALAKKGETSLMDAVNACIDVVKENQYYSKWYTEAKEQSGTE